jgi:AraC-like DNA-binding protein
MEQGIASHTSRARVRAPQIVERLDAFLLGHLSETTTISRLCRVTGVSERSLRNACHAVCGTSPKRYQTRRRLEAVRVALAEARPGRDTVTRIATDFGFFELGRFAAIYSSAFGERPSETLKGAGEPAFTIGDEAADDYAVSAALQKLQPNESEPPKSFNCVEPDFGRLS